VGESRLLSDVCNEAVVLQKLLEVGLTASYICSIEFENLKGMLNTTIGAHCKSLSLVHGKKLSRVAAPRLTGPPHLSYTPAAHGKAWRSDAMHRLA
jgi:hypothetical protein